MQTCFQCNEESITASITDGSNQYNFCSNEYELAFIDALSFDRDGQIETFTSI